MSAFSEHEYEPISPPSMPSTLSTLNAQRILNAAPVVRFDDTDVAHVADSDDSTDAQERRYTPNLVLDGDVVVPLDGEIEDNAMQARELGGTGDTSEDQETAQQLQDRLEERFLTAATPCTESRTDAEINTSQVNSAALEEQPLQRGARGFPQRLRSQAGKLRTRLRGIQRPTFSLPLERKKTDKTKTKKAEKPKDEKAKSAEKSRFSLPDRPKFNLPERPKFNFPERAKFSMPERPKFNIKRPNINLPTLGRVKKPLKERQHSSESNSSAKRNIFDFSTYPRLFDKKSKNRGEYATSSPKASRAQSPESATVPRVKKKVPIGARWVQRFSDIKYADDEPENAVDRSKPWRHPSIEEPQVALRQETPESRRPLPWEISDDRSAEPSHEKPDEESHEEDLRGQGRNARYEEDSVEVDNRRIIVELPLGPEFLGNPEEDSDERIVPDLSDPRLYPGEPEEDSFEAVRREVAKEKWRHEQEESVEVDEPGIRGHPDDEEGGEMPGQDSYGRDEYSGEMIPEDDGYDGRNFHPIDPRKYSARELTPEETSIRSDREQQSSGSSSDRRRRGVLEEIDSDEFFLRAKGISQDDMNMGRFLASEIRDAFRPAGNALADQDFDLAPPTRPVRTRSLRKTRRVETPPEVFDATPPARPKRDRRRSEDSMRIDEYENFLPEKNTGSISGSRHRIIYQAEETPPAVEPLDDIVVVKPARRKSRSVAKSNSEFGSGVFQPPPMPPTPPVAPRRRKRGRRDPDPDAAYVNGHGPIPAVCNGHRRNFDWPQGIGFLPETHDQPEILDRIELENFASRLDHEYIEPAPIAPKRKSRSRGTSVADDDRTSRGAESLPEVSYLEEDTAPREPEGDPPGYAVVDKREKPPRPPPPRRRRDKFATTPRSHADPSSPDIPSVPVRPRRAYSTLGPSRRRSSSEERSVNQMDVTPYTELDDGSDDPDSRDLQSGQQVVNKIQGRPLPAPPRPPRARRDAPDQVSLASNGVLEVAASTQTDPLPDDLVIEEEVTRAKLVMAPSRSGSQVLVSTERIASPTFDRQSSPAVPPLPRSVSPDRYGEPSNEVEEETAEVHRAEDRDERLSTPATPATSFPLQQEDRIRIASLEVADLRVERLNVNVIEAQKVSASEVDAIVVSASEISSAASPAEPGIHPSLLKELIAIRSHLEQAAAARSQGRELTPEIVRAEEVPVSAVNELIAALKNSDRNEEAADELLEESEMVEAETVQKETSDLVKSPDDQEEQSVSPIVDLQEVDQPKEKTGTVVAGVDSIRENLAGETLDGDNSLEEKTSDSKPLRESSPSDSVPQTLQMPTAAAAAAAVSEGQEIIRTHVPASLTTPPAALPKLSTAKEDDRPRGRPSSERKEDRHKSSRSRSPSPTIDGKRPVRQTASPVKSLPPVISVTPDLPDAVPSPIPETQVQPQRGIISYAPSAERDSVPRESPSVSGAQFVAFPTSQIPASFFSLASPVDSRSVEYESEPGLVETTQQLLRALRIAGTRAMRHFVGYIASRVSVEDRGEKTKEIELAICALLLLIAGLLILCFGSPRTVTHHHHWDYFNPPQ